MRLSLFAALLLAAAFTSAAPATAQVYYDFPALPGVTLPPDARYAPGTFIPTPPDASENELDEKGYSTGDPENPPSN